MQYCVDHPEEISKLAKVKAQVSEVKGVMMENIEKVRQISNCLQLLTDYLNTKLISSCWVLDFMIYIINLILEHTNFKGL